MSKDSFVIVREQRPAFDCLSDDDAGRLIKAVLAYQFDGIEPDLPPVPQMAFAMMKPVFERFAARYAETCRKRKEAGAKGGKAKAANASKSQQEQANVANASNAKQSLHDRDRDRDRDPQRDRGRERERDPEAASAAKSTPPAADTTTTTRESIEEDIIEAWHWQDCTTELRSIGGKRWDRTEMAMAVAGGKDAFLDLIRSLDSHAYLKTHRVDYDWFVDPKNFQNILEGKYKEPHKPARKEGWE